MNTLTLNYLRKGESAKILHVYGHADQKKHLTNLGFVPGVYITIISTQEEEMIIKLKGSRLGVSKEFTKNVTIERININEKELVPLSQLMAGSQAKVARVDGEAQFRRRIMDMGITKNAIIDLVKLAPLGDPLEIRVRGYQLSIRKSEADSVQTVVISGGVRHA
ncbi:FeoA family protein [Facklamia miroungae]|uniref:Ferrous iron transport protein A n=1 Tax=Facklamia miroungae TaxID=120956 RepID=A0A1G7QH47_9LACT|nr:ferrous iron transport protein A [Facklamia miroungae]NKZ28939.1 ferrous iron transport protein A [Facklamia miroungae]SDF97834.1 ferrous iron transport protein A [Facklamia miroungae]